MMAVSTAITPLIYPTRESDLAKSHTKLNESKHGNSFFNLNSSFNDLFTCQNLCDLSPKALINTDTNYYNNQNLRINKVGSYVELRLKRLSSSKCLINESEVTKSFSKLHRLESHPYYNDNNRRHSVASSENASTNSSNYKSSRSRSPSESSSSYSFFSPFAQDSSFRIKKPKKLKLSLTKKMSGFATSSQTAPNISALGKKLNSSTSAASAGSTKKKAKKKGSQRTIKASNGSSRFSKLNEDFQSKHNFLSVSPLNNFDSMSNVNINCNVNTNKKLKCLLVGDAQVGKSALMFLFLKRIFQHEYRPTIVDDYEVKIVLNGEAYTLSLFDTAGQEDWETLRVMAYPDTDVILLCYSVVRPDSMENIKTKWMPELNKYLPDALIVLVGTQVDLRENSMTLSTTDPRLRHITTREGEELKQKINAFRYIECSALTQLNIKEVFDSCIEAYAKSNPPVQPSCFETLLKRFTKTIRSRFNIRLHSSNSTSSSNTNKNSTKLAKYSNKETKYLHEQ